ncbi:MAG TPA: hypothetical protein VK654_07860, partial [Nitrospirota bacterium]|nr:hypothetical protein [Nitrospirota bacterium]
LIMVMTVFIGCGGGSNGNNTNQPQSTNLPGDTTPNTSDAIEVTDSSAFIQAGFSNPSGYVTTIWLEYGPTSSYGSTVSPWPTYSATGSYGLHALLSSLTGSKLYHYRLGTNNAGGTFYSNDKTFTTYMTPATLVSSGSGSNPNSNGYDNPNSITLDSTNIYWTDDNGGVNKIGITGGAITTLATGTYPSHIAIDSSNVYWNDRGSIFKIGKNGGSIASLVSNTSITASVFNLTTDVANVYWADGLSIFKTELNSGTTTTFGVTTTSNGFSTIGLAIDTASLYWIESPLSGYGAVTTTLKRADLISGTTTTLSTTPLTPWGYHIVAKRPIVMDSTSVYWTDGFSIYKVGLNGGAETVLSAGAGALAVDSTSVYWTSGFNPGYGCISCVNKVGINGGSPTILTCIRDCNIDITVDSTSVYWITDSSAIKKIAK